uniref:Tetraspanin n=2 Tax=Timema TaxID=61471 RepID=A0A7R9E1E6_9NEOP|nr:unnamed protein product [Timema monikensis]
MLQYYKQNARCLQHNGGVSEYGAFLMVIFIVELGAGVSIFAYREKLQEGFDKGLNQSLNNYDSHSDKSTDFDLMQSTVSTDFDLVRGAVGTYFDLVRGAVGTYFDLVRGALHCCGSHDYMDWKDTKLGHVPISCCMNTTSCDTDDVKQIYTEGCYDKVVNFLDANIGLVGGAALGVAFFPLVGVILSCCLAKNINKAKYEQMA